MPTLKTWRIQKVSFLKNVGANFEKLAGSKSFCWYKGLSTNLENLADSENRLQNLSWCKCASANSELVQSSSYEGTWLAPGPGIETS